MKSDRHNAPVRHETETLDPARAPKKHVLGPADDQMHVGSLVFYHGERFWVSICPEHWGVTHHVRICSKRTRTELPEPRDAECFYVHADVLDISPDQNQIRPKTLKAIATGERVRAGKRDVGDEVAEILRPLTLDQMFTTAAAYLGENEEALKAKYAHLDNGRKRMTLGNRMRAKHKKEQS